MRGRQPEYFLIASHQQSSHNEPLRCFSPGEQRGIVNGDICLFHQRLPGKLDALCVLNTDASITIATFFA
jgi:hypothetical protein